MLIIGASPTIANCRFVDNEAYGFVAQGGGGAIACQFSSAIITACTFVGNEVDEHIGVGGAVVAKVSLVTITDCEFIDNLAISDPPIDSSGGATAFTAVADANDGKGRFADGFRYEGQVSGCRFVNNEGGDGGAIYADHDVTIDRCSFSGNTAENTGGGVSVHAAATISECIFAGNRAGSFAGGLSGDGVALTVIGCTFVGNGAPDASVSIDDGTIENTIIAFGSRGKALLGCPPPSDHPLLPCAPGQIKALHCR